MNTLDKLKPGITRLASKLAGSNLALMDDLRAEGVFSAYRCSVRYKDKKEHEVIKLAGTTARNAMYSMLRSERYRATTDISEYDPVWQSIGPDSEAEFSEFKEYLSKQLTGLPAIIFADYINPSDELWQIATDRTEKNLSKTTAGKRSVEITGRDLAKMHGVSHATVSRAMTQIREQASEFSMLGL
jgi:hypothetical protein